MKIYNKFRKLKTSTKISLATSSIYAATSLALPAYAAVKQEKPKTEVITLEELERADTVEKADSLFHTKLNEYSLDKELNSLEIRNLRTILVREENLLSKGKAPGVKQEYVKFEKELEVLDETITDLEHKLEDLKKSYLNFYERKKTIKDLLSKEYPGIFDKKNTEFNIIYPATLEITQKNIRTLITETAEAVHLKLGLGYNNETLKSILDSNDLTLKAVAKLFTVMETYGKSLSSSKKDLELRQNLEKEIKDLKSKKEDFQNANKDKVESMEGLVNSQNRLTKTLGMFSDYVTFEDLSKKFIEKYCDRSKLWSSSVLAEHLWKGRGGYDYLDSCQSFTNNQGIGVTRYSTEKALDQYLHSQGLEAEVAALKDPTEYKFPAAWFIFVNALAVPVIRNVLVRTYMGRRDFECYAASVGAGSLSWLAGIFILDGLHPWAYWARMGSPLLLQPLKRAFKKYWES